MANYVANTNIGDFLINDMAELSEFTLAQLRGMLGKKPNTKGKAIEQVWGELVKPVPAPAAEEAPVTNEAAMVHVADLGNVLPNSTQAVMAELVGTDGITLGELVEGTLEHYKRPHGGEMTKRLVLRRLRKAVKQGRFTITEVE
jgi:hypothetical protein